jgi:uncharacterized protein (DUF2147 family)
MRKIIIVTIIALLASASYAQSIVGKWQTIDDNTGKAKSVVEIYQKDGKYFGKIVQLFLPAGVDQDPVCDVCTDYRKNAKVIGMNIIEGMTYSANDKEYSGGKILDPENGKIYKSKLWLGKDGKLNVRGYIGPFYRTQTWLPVK